MKELKLIKDFTGEIKEFLEIGTIFSINRLIQRQAQKSYQQGREEAIAGVITLLEATIEPERYSGTPHAINTVIKQLRNQQPND